MISSLHDVLSQMDKLPADPVGESTRLIGSEAVLDSLGLVTLVIDLEQRLEEQHGMSLVLADDRAMSQGNSPFRTVQALTDYISLLIEEEREYDRA